MHRQAGICLFLMTLAVTPVHIYAAASGLTDNHGFDQLPEKHLVIVVQRLGG
jgi:uncharacterized membrane protein